MRKIVGILTLIICIITVTVGHTLSDICGKCGKSEGVYTFSNIEYTSITSTQHSFIVRHYLVCPRCSGPSVPPSRTETGGPVNHQYTRIVPPEVVKPSGQRIVTKKCDCGATKTFTYNNTISPK